MKPQDRRKVFEASAEDRPAFHELYRFSQQIKEMTRERFRELYEGLFEFDFAELEKRVHESIRGHSKQELQDDYIRGFYPDLVVLDEWHHLKPLTQPAELKDWEHKIPDPNPFNRAFSAPSEKTRAKLRAKRKRRT